MLKNNIEKQREKMIAAAKMYGYSSKLTVKYSQELDKMLNVVLFENNTGHEKIS
ncbi:aspartyl-phosphate phosphatase Spo0E family protein [Bacillus solimangrovi]|uniref:aspartyl-phosphate phosphatase Spo0E family protein n=1 Tax=Bacillus solimangrovi TaxID=1305675 RepID=UPI001112DB72|nr:aspartyl-phosphate phosphatase Spo0E family protein [Bacillus solimangrovi]